MFDWIVGSTARKLLDLLGDANTKFLSGFGKGLLNPPTLFKRETHGVHTKHLSTGDHGNLILPVLGLKENCVSV